MDIEDHLNFLRQKVQQQFGKKITTATDCDVLARQLHTTFSVTISAQTLRRFFGLIKTNSGPGTYTLDLLSRFAGHKNWDCFKSTAAAELWEIFTKGGSGDSAQYWLMSEQLCAQISESPDLLVRMHHRLMPYPLARKFFIEHHPMRDLLGGVYAQYFVEYLKYNSDLEAKIFAFGFLFKSAFLTKNDLQAELYYRKLKELHLTLDVHVIPAALKFGIELLYEDKCGDEVAFHATFSSMKILREKFEAKSRRSVCSFEYTVLESLIFTDRTGEMHYLIENHIAQEEGDEPFIPLERKRTHQEVWKILCAAAYAKSGNLKVSRSYLIDVDLNRLGIGWKKYYTIIYLLATLETDSAENQSEVLHQVKQLIANTHFSFFNIQWQKVAERVYA